MKKLILLLFCFICFVKNVAAQEISSSAEKRINLLTRVMATELNLNESEYLRLQALNRERIIKADEIAEFYNNEPALLAKKIAQLEISFDQKFTAMLSPEQLATYSQYKHRPNTPVALSGETKAPENKAKSNNQ